MRLKWWRYRLCEAVMSMKGFDATEIIRVLAGQLITVAAMADGSSDSAVNVKVGAAISSFKYLTDLRKLPDGVYDADLVIQLSQLLAAECINIKLKLNEVSKESIQVMAVLQKEATAASIVAEDFARQFESGKAERKSNVLVVLMELQHRKDEKKLLKESRFSYSVDKNSSLQVYAMQPQALLNLLRHDDAYSAFQNVPVIDLNISARLFPSSVTSNFFY
ncbi:hypothetical protein Tco_0978913 [Tanacetum coccineum]|uniref:Uncharacterized protein n=1 Tax=Tanacetum coccineum TaxID=301880 RepID=A0ABQ5EPA2_9ASTR